MANNVKMLKQAAACVRCKAQGQGAKKCREEKGHDLTDHPGTTLSGAMCKALMEFRSKEYPQPNLTADQRLLEQELSDGGASAAESALTRLKAAAAGERAQPDNNAPPQADDAVDSAPAETEWEEQLAPFAEQIAGVPEYIFRTRQLTHAEADSMLQTDKFFMGVLTSTGIAAKHLTTSNSALSKDKGAVNCLDNMCCELREWLMLGRVDSWQCADANCTGQHDCAAGRNCDASVCHLHHPGEELRWVVFNSKTQCWPEPMSLDEAMHYDGKYLRKALAESEEGCTHADIWRASTEVMAYGRRVLPVSAPPALTTPAPAAAVVQAVPPASPAAAAAAASNLTVALVPAGQAAPAGVTPASAIDITGGAADSIVPQSQKRKYDPATPSPAEDEKRAKIAAEPAVDPLARGYDQPTLLTSAGVVNSLNFVEGARVWASANLSEAVKEIVQRAGELTPAERSALLASVANMIQQDQSRALNLLNHSLTVSQYFANLVPK
jgi:hypothetical protein